MYLKRLELFQFRNLASQEICFEHPVTIITGKNGHGKTSLLESIHLLSHAKSFRGSKPRELVSWDASQAGACSVNGHVEIVDGSREISYLLRENKKQVLLNGKRITAAEEFYGNVRSISFIPSDLAIVSGAPALRRQFIDRTLSLLDSNYVRDLVNYQRALKGRNALLKEGSSLLEPWEILLVEHGQGVSKSRNDFIKALEPYFSEYYSFFSGGAKTRISLESNFELESNLLAAYEESRKRDLRDRKTSLGIHRDDLSIEFCPSGSWHQARGFASQGQTRSLTLALKFAAVRLVQETKGDAPILLLDDVESELDYSRRRALYELLRDFSGQVFITATELSDETKECLSSVVVLKLSSGRIET